MCGSKFFSLLFSFSLLYKSTCLDTLCSGGNGVQVSPTDFYPENKTFILIRSNHWDHEPNDLFFASLRDHSICTTYQLLFGEEDKLAYLEVVEKDPKIKTKNYFFYNNKTQKYDYVVDDTIVFIRTDPGYDLYGLSYKDILVIKRCVTDGYNISTEALAIFIPIKPIKILLHFSLSKIVEKSLLASNSTTLTRKMFPESIDDYESICSDKVIGQDKNMIQWNSFIIVQSPMRGIVILTIVIGLTIFLFNICKRLPVWRLGLRRNSVSPLE